MFAVPTCIFSNNCMVIIHPPPPLASPSLSCRRHLKPLYQRAYSPNCMVIIHTPPITFFAEQDIMYYFLTSHKIYTLFSSFFLLAINKGNTSLRHWVLVPVSWLVCTTRQNSTIFKRSLHMQGFSGERVSYWWAQGREGKFHPSLERYSQGRVYNRN